ncbi:hypothetical protein QYE76_050339 [Lolium multiflorum]|uniref:F-box domain-containing protein n=1 Tax=Lolium multiflorum TaxID=4521 RepID=A0AAD8SQP2_LOLMU|nr:hypothetical protein QYE76_050339 [Lolium multiflorum]
MEPPSNQIGAAADDRLSDLPDCLIQSILSFLESRQVVRSSLLSRRWRHLWRSVPCIDMDLTVFRHGDICRDGKCCEETWGRRKVCKKEWRPFVDFGNNLLLLNNSRSLDKLRIHIPLLDTSDTEAIHPLLRWITTGIRCSPAAIDIHIDAYCIWGNCCLPDLGSSSSRLTKLFLHGVMLDAGFAEQLPSRYPVLEELSLVRCPHHFSEIMSVSLRHLTIDDCSDYPRKQGPARKGMVVTAPRLTSLRVSFSTVCCSKGIRVTHTSSFVKLSICVTSFRGINDGFRHKLCDLFNVMHIELFGAKMRDAIQWMADTLPKFRNVRTLSIDGCNLKTKANIQALDSLFLQNVPGLTKLNLQNCEVTQRGLQNVPALTMYTLQNCEFSEDCKD